MYTDKKLADFKRQLTQIQKELRNMAEVGNAAAETVELDQTRVGRLSRMDALQGQAMSQETNRRRQIQLKNIDAALNRIDEGNFGYCQNCDEEIAVKRLEIDPATPLCITCASKAEKVGR